MLLPILFLGAAALLFVNRSKAQNLFRAKLVDADMRSFGVAFAGSSQGAPATLGEQGIAKVRAKLERQQADLEDPLAVLTLSNLHQAFFHSLEAGSEKVSSPSALGDICDALELASEATDSDPVLFISPRPLRRGGVEWLSGFVVTTGEPSGEDFASGGALEGCIRVGDYESLKSAKFC